ncbi:MAG: hypothetical protein GY941_13305 [Planctomycetes bacterium]|nr:hypothetical protein [Planctomycetota bacterium]
MHPNEASNVSDDGKIGGVIHCFSGNSDTAKKFLDLGFHISFAGPVTRKRKTKRAILS